MSTPPGWKVDHIGIAVHDLEQAIKLYATLGNTKVLLRETVEAQGVEVAFLDTQGTSIELLAPYGSQSKLTSFLAKRGPGLHHICYEVQDISATMKRLSDDGFKLIDKTPREGARGSIIAFVSPQSTHGVLTELCEYSGC